MVSGFGIWSNSIKSSFFTVWKLQKWHFLVILVVKFYHTFSSPTVSFKIDISRLQGSILAKYRFLFVVVSSFDTFCRLQDSLLVLNSWVFSMFSPNFGVLTWIQRCLIHDFSKAWVWFDILTWIQNFSVHDFPQLGDKLGEGNYHFRVSFLIL